MDRYIRQETLEILPKNFQRSIKNKKITLVGCGGVGSVLGQLLIRGGFLNLILIDNDKVDITNLQRQAFFEEDIGEYKTKTLKKHLIKINKEAKITITNRKINTKNIESIFANSDLIIDATDNFTARKLINKYCEENKKDWIYNGAVKSEAISYIFYGKLKQFKILFPKEIKEEKASDIGILPSTTFLAASLGFNQTVKYFIKHKTNNLIKINLWNNKLFEIKIK